MIIDEGSGPEHEALIRRAGELYRLGRKVDVSLPDPDNVPEMAAELAAALRVVTELWQQWIDGGRLPSMTNAALGSPRGWRAAIGEVRYAGDRLDTAIWRLRVASQRWVHEMNAEARRHDSASWWAIWQGVMALRWRANARRGPLPGFLPSRELAVREPAAVEALTAAEAADPLHSPMVLRIAEMFRVPVGMLCGHSMCLPEVPAFWTDDGGW